MSSFLSLVPRGAAFRVTELHGIIQVKSGWERRDQGVVFCRRLWARKEIPFSALLSKQHCKRALVKWKSLVPERSYTKPPLSAFQSPVFQLDTRRAHALTSAGPPQHCSTVLLPLERFLHLPRSLSLRAERSLPFLLSPSPSPSKVRSPISKKDHLLLWQNSNTEQLAKHLYTWKSPTKVSKTISDPFNSRSQSAQMQRWRDNGPCCICSEALALAAPLKDNLQSGNSFSHT